MVMNFYTKLVKDKGRQVNSSDDDNQVILNKTSHGDIFHMRFSK